ncbi:antitoxin [Actinomycetota bacterium]|nr:antitoxin [Actinomycetota bacterium]
MAAMSSREFNQGVALAKRIANNEPVFVTDRGKVSYVLLNINDYNDLTGNDESLVSALFNKAAADIEFEIPKLQMTPREFEL